MREPQIPAARRPGPQTEDSPVFDRGTEPLPPGSEDPLPTDEEGNLLPGNDPLDEDPNDNGAQEQFDPEDIRRRRLTGQPLQE